MASRSATSKVKTSVVGKRRTPDAYFSNARIRSNLWMKVICRATLSKMDAKSSPIHRGIEGNGVDVSSPHSYRGTYPQTRKLVLRLMWVRAQTLVSHTSCCGWSRKHLWIPHLCQDETVSTMGRKPQCGRGRRPHMVYTSLRGWSSAP
jgi:hypothetical protein